MGYLHVEVRYSQIVCVCERERERERKKERKKERAGEIMCI